MPFYLSVQDKNKGFSLIELLIVLVIIGFMVVLIPPRLSALMETIQIKSAARNLVSALRQTRNAAITTQKEHVLRLDLANKTYSFKRKNMKKLPEKLQINLYTARTEQISDQVGAIRFYPDGSSTGGRIRLKMGKQTRYIDINWLTGKVALLENIHPEEWISGGDGFTTIN